MRIIVLFMVLSVAPIGLSATAFDLEYLREHYDKAASDKKICETIISQLEGHAQSNVHLAYLGAYQAIRARHIINPFTKLSTFIHGKNNIEKAIQQNPDNAEIRFIRLSIQKNSPAFLAYKNNIAQDKRYIQLHKNSITSPALLRMVDNLLIE